jgi:hypothetical protein
MSGSGLCARMIERDECMRTVVRIAAHVAVGTAVTVARCGAGRMHDRVLTCSSSPRWWCCSSSARFLAMSHTRGSSVSSAAGVVAKKKSPKVTGTLGHVKAASSIVAPPTEKRMMRPKPATVDLSQCHNESLDLGT